MKSERLVGCPGRAGPFQAGDRHRPCVAGAEKRLVRGSTERAGGYEKKLGIHRAGPRRARWAEVRSSVFLLRLVCLHLGW